MELGNLSKKRLIKTLKDTQVELEACREQHPISKQLLEVTYFQQELHKNDISFRAVVENIKEVVFSTDIQGHWTFLNNCWEEITGFRVIETLGSPFLNYMHPDDIDISLELFKSLIEREKEYCRHKIRCSTKNGEFLWIEVYATLAFNPNNEMVGTCGTLLDITESIKIEEFEKEFLLLTPKLIGAPSEKIDNVINMAMERIGRFLHTDRSYIFEFSYDGHTMNNTYEWCNDGVSPEIDNLKDIPTAIFPEWMKLLHRNEVIQITDVSTLPDSWSEERKILEDQDIQSLIVIPMMTENELLGYVGLDSVCKHRAYQQAEINILRTWSSILSGLIVHKRSEHIINQQRDNLFTFFNTMDDFLWVLDMQGNIIHTNITVNERLGYLPDELHDQSVLLVHPEQRRDEALQIVMDMLNGSSKYCGVPIVTKTGLEIPVETRVKISVWDGKPCIIGVSKDISKIRLSEEKFSKAFHLSSILMSISNYETGVYIEVNQAFNSILEYSSDELIGKNATDLGIFPDEQLRGMLLKRLEMEHSLKDVELEVRSKSGKRIIGLFTAEKVVINEQDCLLTSMVDITARKKAEEDLLKARQEAVMANMAKSEFLSRMSHELRTPLNSVLGFAQLMQMGSLNSKQQKGVAQILNSGNYLLELINEVLDLARIESGKIAINNDSFHLKGLIYETLDLVKPLANSQGIRINISEIPEEWYLQSDPQLLKQVLVNLLTNAIKYNKPEGEVYIESDILNQGEKTILIVSIKDTGIGIQPELLEKLFQPFERLSQKNSSIEGTGLGMAVVKKIIDAMVGKIQVQSIPETGTTITIEIPCVPTNCLSIPTA